MRKIISFVSAIIFLLVSLFLPFRAKGQEKEILFFYGKGCPHCSEVLEFFENEDILDNYPVKVLEIYFDDDNRKLYSETLDSFGVSSNNRGVPTLVMGENYLVGDTPIIQNFYVLADEYLREGSSLDPSTRQEIPVGSEKGGHDLTILAVIGASLVDAINPCAFAVLIILMSTILISGSSKKALKAGLAFATSIFISYFMMGLGLYTALGIGSVSSIFFKIVGWLAIILGLFNVKDYFWYGKVFIMEVPMGWRPKLKKLIGSVTSPTGAFGVGFLVSLFLLPCTSGPYIVILGMLAENVMRTKAVLYLLLYNLIFIFPMVVISIAVYKGFDPSKAEKIRQNRLKTLHLIAGTVLLLMGTAIIVGWI